jgi:hypothetical protein
VRQSKRARVELANDDENYLIVPDLGGDIWIKQFLTTIYMCDDVVIFMHVCKVYTSVLFSCQWTYETVIQFEEIIPKRNGFQACDEFARCVCSVHRSRTLTVTCTITHESWKHVTMKFSVPSFYCDFTINVWTVYMYAYSADC